jgi:hypothetical protein
LALSLRRLCPAGGFALCTHFCLQPLDRLAKISPDGEPISFVLPKEIGERKGACPVPLESPAEKSPSKAKT